MPSACAARHAKFSDSGIGNSSETTENLLSDGRNATSSPTARSATTDRMSCSPSGRVPPTSRRKLNFARAIRTKARAVAAMGPAFEGPAGPSSGAKRPAAGLRRMRRAPILYSRRGASCRGGPVSQPSPEEGTIPWTTRRAGRSNSTSILCYARWWRWAPPTCTSRLPPRRSRASMGS